MFQVNKNISLLPESYLFSEIASRVANYKKANPDKEVVSLGIGDVTQVLPNSVIGALHAATNEMAVRETFRGYAPECGYDFIKKAIIETDYSARGVEIAADEVFINDGAKSSLGHFGDILSVDNSVAVCDPVYPVYVDTNVMEGRAGCQTEDGSWSKLTYLKCTVQNGFTPSLPEKAVDVIYLCSPNNPTGCVLNRKQLTDWVEYARKNKSIILFDGAYEAFISSPDIPHSIYEIEGAKEVAVEFRSFSKTAGFTGLRCGYTIVPKELKTSDGTVLNTLWRRHQTTKFNGTSYVIQRAAEAVYSEQGQAETKALVAYYMNNAKQIRKGLQAAGYTTYGGENAPYIWVVIPEGMTSWNFFDKLLNRYQIVGTPGVGFGPAGEGYIRFTAFATAENVAKAMARLSDRD